MTDGVGLMAPEMVASIFFSFHPKKKKERELGRREKVSEDVGDDHDDDNNDDNDDDDNDDDYNDDAIPSKNAVEI